MMEDFDDFDLTPEQEADLERAMQDCNDGFFYTMLEDENGKPTRKLQCNKCKRVGSFLERPFPHRFDCEMKR